MLLACLTTDPTANWVLQPSILSPPSPRSHEGSVAGKFYSLLLRDCVHEIGLANPLYSLLPPNLGRVIVLALLVGLLKALQRQLTQMALNAKMFCAKA